MLTGRFLLALRHEYGTSLTIAADDGYLSGFGRAASAASQHALAGMFISGGYLTDPSRQLPPAGQAFVREFSATQPKRIVNTFTPYAAQATEVLLAAIAASDGTRQSVVKHLLGVRVRDGILGSFGFDRNGDMTTSSMPTFRVPAKPTLSGSYPVYALIQVPSSYTDKLVR